MPGRHPVQHATVQVALLQPGGRGTPQALPIADRQRFQLALHRRVNRGIVAPASDRSIPGVIAQQGRHRADPDLTAGVFLHRLQPLRAIHAGPVLGHPAADRVELVQRPVRSHRPHFAIGGGGHAQHVAIAQ